MAWYVIQYLRNLCVYDDDDDDDDDDDCNDCNDCNDDLDDNMFYSMLMRE